MPAAVLHALSPLTALPGLPRIRGDEVRRLMEDKAFPIDAMQRILGINPIALPAGLAMTFKGACVCPSSIASPSSTPT